MHTQTGTTNTWDIYVLSARYAWSAKIYIVQVEKENGIFRIFRNGKQI